MNKGIYYASFTALLWGFLAIAIKVSLNGLPPITVSWSRFAIAFITLAVYYALFDRKCFSIIQRAPKFGLLAGFFLGMNYLGFISGIHLTSPSIGQIFIQAGPVLFAVAGFVIFRERANIRQATGLLIVVVGLVIFYNEQILNIAGGLKSYKLGVAMVLFGALSWSLYAIFQKKAVQKDNPMQLNLIVFGLPSLFYIPLVDFTAFATLRIVDWFVVIFLGLNTLAAYGSLAYALKYLEANKISVIITLNPLITFALMAWLSKKELSWIEPETFTLLTLGGALLVLIGVILTVVRKR
ncbi:MAG TPA: EamA/RhaT family transporter [Bacteroidales bacterium]|nr:EamA/RhaT family transporter [Bacteroidales bacterium]